MSKVLYATVSHARRQCNYMQRMTSKKQYLTGLTSQLNHFLGKRHGCNVRIWSRQHTYQAQVTIKKLYIVLKNTLKAAPINTVDLFYYQWLFYPTQDLFYHSQEKGTWKPALIQSTLSEYTLACFRFVIRQSSDFQVRCWHILSMPWIVWKNTWLPPSPEGRHP